MPPLLSRLRGFANALWLQQELRQLGDIGGNPSRLVACEHDILEADFMVKLFCKRSE
jgi:hypothetical protein